MNFNKYFIAFFLALSILCRAQSSTHGYALYNTSVVFVKQLSDLPAAVSGTITLTGNTTYKISGTISLGTSILVMGNGTSIKGSNQATDILYYTGSGTMINISDVSGDISTVSISCASGIVFNADCSTGLCNYLLYGVVITGAKTLGTIQGFNNFVIQSSLITGTTTSGFSLGTTHATGNFATINSEFSSNAGTLFALSTSTIGFMTIHGNIFYCTAGQTVFSGTPTVNNKINVIDNSFTGGGTYTSQNIVPSNIYCQFISNIGVDPSESVGECYLVANTTSTTITVQGTFYKAAGTTSAGTLERFTHSNNRLTYTGLETIKLLVTSAASVTSATNNETLGTKLAKNGTVINASEAESRQTTANQSVNCISKSIVQFSTGDYVELFVTNKTSTGAVTVEYLNLTCR